MRAPATDPTPGGTGHALVVRDLSAGYRGVPVVRELNLEVRPGEVVALLGPNGAGKTTTLETIAGLNHPISGTVELSGEKVGGTPAYQLAGRGLSLVPEGRALFPGLTVREHLRLAGGRGARGRRAGPGGRRAADPGPTPGGRRAGLERAVRRAARRAGAGGRRSRLRPDARPDRARGSRRRAPRAAGTARRQLPRGDGRLTGAASPCVIKRTQPSRKKQR